jgi:hypothetical protein
MQVNAGHFGLHIWNSNLIYTKKQEMLVMFLKLIKNINTYTWYLLIKLYSEIKKRILVEFLNQEKKTKFNEITHQF